MKREPRPIADDQLVTLQALADHAAIALSNSDLLGRLEARAPQLKSILGQADHDRHRGGDQDERARPRQRVTGELDHDDQAGERPRPRPAPHERDQREEQAQRHPVDQVRQQRQGQEAVGDGAAEGRVLRRLRIDVDELVVHRHVGELVDHLLGDLDPLARLALLADQGLELGVCGLCGFRHLRVSSWVVSMAGRP